MSYSFAILGATKAAALLLVTAEFDKIVASQACHQADRAQAVAAAEAFVGVLPDDDSKDVAVQMSGSLSGNWSGGDLTSIISANMSITARLVDKAAA